MCVCVCAYVYGVGVWRRFGHTHPSRGVILRHPPPGCPLTHPGGVLPTVAYPAVRILLAMHVMLRGMPAKLRGVMGWMDGWMD